MKIELNKEELKLLKRIRKYFGENDVRKIEYLAYSFTDKIIKRNIVLVDVSNRRELLIAALHGWKDYKDQGISIEDYVDEIESNL